MPATRGSAPQPSPAKPVVSLAPNPEDALFTPLRFAALTLAFIAILLLRDPEWIFHPVFFAEDGSIFYREELIHGPKAFFLPYNGYFHLLPRAVALAVSFLPVIAAPAVCIGFAFAVQALCYSSLLWPGFRYLVKSDWIRVAAASVFAAAIPGGELIGTLCNMQWHLMLPALLLLFLPDGAEGSRFRLPPRIAAALAVVIGLTCPGMILMLPFSVWRVIKGSGRARLVALAFAVTALIQAVCAYFVPRMNAPVDTSGGSVLLVGRMISSIFISWVYRVELPMTGGEPFSKYVDRSTTSAPYLVLLTLTAIALTWLWAHADRRQRLLLAAAVFITAGSIGSGLYAANLIDWFQSINRMPQFYAERYFTEASYVFIGVFAVLLDQTRRLRGEVAKAALLLLISAGGMINDFPVKPYPPLDWKESAKQVGAWRAAHARRSEIEVRVPIQPNTQLYLPGRDGDLSFHPEHP